MFLFPGNVGIEFQLGQLLWTHFYTFQQGKPAGIVMQVGKERVECNLKHFNLVHTLQPFKRLVALAQPRKSACHDTR